MSKNIILKKTAGGIIITIIAFIVYILLSITLTSIFYVKGDMSWHDSLQQYLRGWSGAIVALVIVPLLIGMVITIIIKEVVPFWFRLFFITIVYIGPTFLLVCMEAEPKAPDMNVYMWHCIIMISTACVFSTIGHFIAKRIHRVGKKHPSPFPRSYSTVFLFKNNKYGLIYIYNYKS